MELSRSEMEAIVSDFPDREARVLRLIWEHDDDRRRAGGSPAGMGVIHEGLAGILARFGLPPIELLQELRARWREIAGPHWGSQATPIVVRHGVLLVEAVDRRLVRRLAYDTDRLLERLEGVFGKGFVIGVRVAPPPRDR